MPNQPTPGEVNFETYWRMLDGLPPFLMTWEQLMPDDRAAWEAAAQAVLTQAGRLVLDLDPEERRDA